MTAWGFRAFTSGALVVTVLAGCTGGGGEGAVRDDVVPTTGAPTSTATPATDATTTTARAASERRVTRISLPRPSTTTTTLPPTTLATTTTTLPPTTLATTTTTAPPTTTAPTTTVPASLPVPVPAPPEDGSDEPQVELGTIEIPAIGLQRTMQEGIKLSTLDRGPGHWPGTAMPGEVGNVVVAGHRVSHNQDFRHVDALVPGDEVVFTTAAGRFVYHVVSTEIVPPSALWIVDQGWDHTATLFACHPPGSTRERIVVHLALA